MPLPVYLVLRANRYRLGVASIGALTAVFLAGPMANSAQAAGATVVPLGTARAFSVLAG